MVALAGKYVKGALATRVCTADRPEGPYSRRLQGAEPPIPIPVFRVIMIPDLPGDGDGGPIPDSDWPGIGGPSRVPTPIPDLPGIGDHDDHPHRHPHPRFAIESGIKLSTIEYCKGVDCSGTGRLFRPIVLVHTSPINLKLTNLRRPAMSDDAVASDYGGGSDAESESDQVPGPLRLPARAAECAVQVCQWRMILAS